MARVGRRNCLVEFIFPEANELLYVVLIQVHGFHGTGIGVPAGGRKSCRSGQPRRMVESRRRDRLKEYNGFIISLKTERPRLAVVSRSSNYR
jgi:hypothetical protein